MEHSEATRETTRWIEMWISNDADHYFGALDCATADPSGHELMIYIRNALERAPHGSAAWHTRRELSAADLESRVDWADIAATLTDI